MEDIDGFHCLISLLFVAKDQVYPVMEVPGDIGWLQSLTENHHEQAGVIVGPGGEVDITDHLSILSLSKIKTCIQRIYSEFDYTFTVMNVLYQLEISHRERELLVYFKF